MAQKTDAKRQRDLASNADADMASNADAKRQRADLALLRQTVHSEYNAAAVAAVAADAVATAAVAAAAVAADAVATDAAADAAPAAPAADAADGDCKILDMPVPVPVTINVEDDDPVDEVKLTDAEKLAAAKVSIALQVVAYRVNRHSGFEAQPLTTGMMIVAGAKAAAAGAKVVMAPIAVSAMGAAAAAAKAAADGGMDIMERLRAVVPPWLV
jgi:hypothetical protein